MDIPKKPQILPDGFSEIRQENPPEITDRDQLRRLFSTISFNAGDGLEEYGGDYRAFEKLSAAAMTAARRHRLPKTMREQPSGDAEVQAGVAKDVESCARTTDPAAGLEALPFEPIELISRGRTLVVGRDTAQVLECGRRLAASQACLLLVEHQPGATSAEAVSHPNLLRASKVRVEGYLGRFNVAARIQGEDVKVSGLPESPFANFDLVLDLRPAAEAGYILNQPGYYAPDGDDRELDRILAELPEMIGVFQKPRFLAYQADICAHKGSGRIACSRCLEVCPTAALTTADERIQIEHAACLGCGLCATVCPTGALRCLHAPVDEILVAVHGRLSEERFQKRSGPMVVFHPLGPDEAAANSKSAKSWQTLFSFPVPEIGCVGPEVWLGALAYGAGCVVLVAPQTYPPTLSGFIAEQIEWVSTILEGIGLDPARIRLEPAIPTISPDPGSMAAVSEAAGFAPFQNKRALIRHSVAHLAGECLQTTKTLDLPAGAPFGTVILDPEACTLCMACAGACPTAALSAAGEVPALNLTESQCIQCGLCRRICPEQALQLRPRIGPDIERDARPRIIHSEEPLTCTRCGKPFASPSLVEKLIKRLDGHWMYTKKEEIQRLKMCSDCRVRDIFSEG